MPDIYQLPPSVINKIAAGEVIERPASVVKELVENSVDAGATRIDVSVEQGGSQLVRVTDNGCGIAPEQFELAVASHATSKIRTADDLFSVESLGFRGEALASIAEISEFVLRSRQAGSESGLEMEVIGGRKGQPSPCGCPEGTTIEVRNLFYNTPVRRKFLRTTQTEMGHVSEAFTRIALSQPHIRFCLRHNDRTIHDLPPVERWSERIVAIFGEEIAANLMWVEGENEDLRVFGYAADPQINRSHTRMQYLFLNGRHIRDRSLQHALGEAYRGLLMTGRSPICFLQVELSPSTVDVNVHPTKLEVRFLDSGRVYAQLLGVLRNKFLTSDLTSRNERDGGSSAETSSQPAQPLMTGYGGSIDDSATRRKELEQIGRDRWSQPSQQSRLEFPSTSASGDLASIGLRPGVNAEPPHAHSPPRPHLEFPQTESTSSESSHHSDSQSRATRSPRGAIQIFNCYLIAQTEQGMLVVDQHALHERILYEQIRTKVLAGRMETQRLLTPEPVNLAPAESAAVLGARETLKQLGLEVEPFGGDTVLVASYPAMLRRVVPTELLRHVVELLLAGGAGPEKRDVLDELLHMTSCKAAIKAGDPLSPEEIDALLEYREICQDSHHCPHGRPTSLVFSREELDKRFGRI